MLILTLEILRFCLLINRPLTYWETVEREGLTLPTSGTQETHFLLNVIWDIILSEIHIFYQKEKIKLNKSKQRDKNKDWSKIMRFIITREPYNVNDIALIFLTKILS